MNPNCLFCKIAGGQTDTKLIWQDDIAAAFNDIHPKAPVHVLVVLKQHYDNIDAVDDPKAIGELLMRVKQVAKQVGVGGNYRIVINTGPHAGMIDHLHVHILGGKPLDE